MKKGIIVIIAIVVLALGILFFLQTPSEMWEEPGWDDPGSESGSSSAGDWGTEVEVGYADGSTESLRVVSNSPFKIVHEDKEVDYFKFKVFAKATGEGYDNCEIDMTAFYVSSAVTGTEVVWSSDGSSGETVTMPLNGVWLNVYEITVNAVDLESLEPTAYTLGFETKGSLQVRGVPNGEWADVGIPTGRSFDFNVQSDGWIDIEFDTE